MTEYIQISSFQHYLFCPRQWALIQVEGQWAENPLTVEGNIQHANAHDDKFTESRGNKYVVRGEHVHSDKLCLSGICDVIEYHQTGGAGCHLYGKEGTWMPIIVEYKHGSPKENDCDRAQLTAEVMCLEEMLCCHIEYAYLFYEQTKHREKVEVTQELRNLVTNSAKEMRQYIDRNYTPKVRTSKKCQSCSLKDICLPKLSKTKHVSDYIDESLADKDKT